MSWHENVHKNYNKRKTDIRSDQVTNCGVLVGVVKREAWLVRLYRPLERVTASVQFIGWAVAETHCHTVASTRLVLTGWLNGRESLEHSRLSSTITPIDGITVCVCVCVCVCVWGCTGGRVVYTVVVKNTKVYLNPSVTEQLPGATVTSSCTSYWCELVTFITLEFLPITGQHLRWAMGVVSVMTTVTATVMATPTLQHTCAYEEGDDFHK